MIGSEKCNYTYYKGLLEISPYGLPKTAIQYYVNEKYYNKIIQESLAID